MPLLRLHEPDRIAARGESFPHHVGIDLAIATVQCGALSVDVLGHVHIAKKSGWPRLPAPHQCLDICKREHL